MVAFISTLRCPAVKTFCPHNGVSFGGHSVGPDRNFPADRHIFELWSARADFLCISANNIIRVPSSLMLMAWWVILPRRPTLCSHKPSARLPLIQGVQREANQPGWMCDIWLVVQVLCNVQHFVAKLTARQTDLFNTMCRNGMVAFATRMLRLLTGKTVGQGRTSAAGASSTWMSWPPRSSCRRTTYEPRTYAGRRCEKLFPTASPPYRCTATDRLNCHPSPIVIGSLRPAVSF